MQNIKTLTLIAISLFALLSGLCAQEYTSTYDFVINDSITPTVAADNSDTEAKKKRHKLTREERVEKLMEEQRYKAWKKERKAFEARQRDTLREERRQNREWQKIANREARQEQRSQNEAGQEQRLQSVARQQPSTNSVEGHVECDFLSQYVWRGIEKGGISIQPRARVEWRGLSLQFSGNTGIESKDHKEINTTLGYNIGGFNIGVTDYWTSGMDYKDRDLYFYFDPQATAHQLEANLGFSCRYFSLQGYTMFWGHDFKYDTVLDVAYAVNGKRAYSTYVELNIPFYMGGLDWDLTGGITPFESAGQFVTVDDGLQRTYFYADSFSCVRASLRATKNFEIGDIKMPVFAELHTNPYMQKAWFVVGMRILPFK